VAEAKLGTDERLFVGEDARLMDGEGLLPLIARILGDAAAARALLLLIAARLALGGADKVPLAAEMELAACKPWLL